MGTQIYTYTLMSGDGDRFLCIRSVVHEIQILFSLGITTSGYLDYGVGITLPANKQCTSTI